jgi:hypothetical protein
MACGAKLFPNKLRKMQNNIFRFARTKMAKDAKRWRYIM